VVSSNKYLAWLALLSAALAAAVAGFNWIIDPYHVFGTPAIEGINRHKHGVSRDRLTAAYRLERVRPEVAFFGSSRTQAGFDPDHPAFTAYRVYNAGLSGPNVHELASYFEFAAGLGSLKTAVIGLDLPMFNADRPNAADFEGDLLGSWTFRRLRQISVAFSIDTLRDAITTLSNQGAQPAHLPNGVRGKAFFNRWIERLGMEGFIRHFELGLLQDQLTPGDVVVQGVSRFSSFQRILRLAHEKDIRLILIVAPTHARYCEMIRLQGNWEKFEFWKRELVRTNEQLAQQHSRPPFPLWDFSGYTSLLIQPLANRETTTNSIRYHWEAMHYTKELGDLVLARVMNHALATSAPADFGVLLTSENVETHLTQTRSAQQRYQIENSADSREIERLVLDLTSAAKCRLMGRRPAIATKGSAASCS
jgi:hypothetical protein